MKRVKKAVLSYQQFGEPRHVLALKHKPIENPKAHEILVRMITSPINPSDLIPITGAYAHRISLPNIPGYEGVGIVVAVGDAVSKDLLGKRVLALRGEGTWQQYVTAPAEFAVVLPKTIDDYTAAQLYINPLTAFVICTEVLQLRATDILVVNACGSAIGRIFAQLSAIIGFTLIAVTRNDTYTKELLSLGAKAVIHTRKESLQEQIYRLTKGRKATAAIDSIGGKEGTELAFCVQEKGVFLTLGLLSGEQVDWGLIDREAQVEAKLFHLRHWNALVTPEKWQAVFRQLINFVQNDQLQFMQPTAYFPLNEYEQAFTFLENKTTNDGKVMFTFNRL